MEELFNTSEEAEKFYSDLDSISEKLTLAKNRYNALYETTEELESPSLKERISRAVSLRVIFIQLETEILQLMEMLKQRPPKLNIFTGEPEQHEGAALGNESNQVKQYTISRNDLLDETRYYIRLLDEIIDEKLKLSPGFPMANDPLQSQSNNGLAPEDSDNIDKNLTNPLIPVIRWKGSPEEFNRQVNILASSQYLQIIDNNIVFIQDDSYEDVIALFYYWFENGNIISQKREGKPLIPQMAIVEAFKRLSNKNVEDFTKGQLSVQKDRMTNEEIEDRMNNYSEILKKPPYPNAQITFP